MKHGDIFGRILFQGILSTSALVLSMAGLYPAAAAGGNPEVQAATAFLEKFGGAVSDEKVMYDNSGTSVYNAYIDRYDDVIVGVPYYGNCQTGEGRVFVFLQRRFT